MTARRSRCGRGSEKSLCPVGEVTPDFDERDDFPVVGKRGVESAQRVGDSAPLFDGKGAGVATVDHVPDK